NLTGDYVWRQSRRLEDGKFQPNRRLRLAAEPQTGRREVSALTDARKTLAYDFFRILRAPLFDNLMTKIP
ncbi:hypothetical protein, partial [Escherichia coli]|uniref:hypothetical protein n=1 Tax=Escherichia coli TaxID=562 RepID=UPI00197AB459